MNRGVPWASTSRPRPRYSPVPRETRGRLPTDLFLAASAWPSDALARVVPPSCARGVARAAPAVTPDRDDSDRDASGVATPGARSPPGAGAQRARRRASLGFRFELSAFAAGAWSPWIAGATVGRAGFAAAPRVRRPLVCEIDEFIANPPAERVRLVLRANADAPAARCRRGARRFRRGAPVRRRVAGVRRRPPRRSGAQPDGGGRRDPTSHLLADVRGDGAGLLRSSRRGRGPRPRDVPA